MAALVLRPRFNCSGCAAGAARSRGGVIVRKKLRDVQELQGALQAKLLRAMCAAVAKVSRAARGHSVFGSDRELRACLALTKLAGSMVGEVTEKPYDRYEDPDWWTPQRLADLEVLCRDDEADETVATNGGDDELDQLNN